jgi:lipid-A-disaccharide synthase
LDLKKTLLALLPGSRQQEIDRHWPIFLETINSLHSTFPNLQFIIGKAPYVSIEDIPSFIKIEKDSKTVLAYSDAGIVASGTVTLEAAVFRLPIAVCYKSSTITHFIGKKLAKVKYLSLPNLIADDKIVPELIQSDMNPKTLIKALIPLLSDTPEKDKMMSAYKKIAAILGKPGVYTRVAKLIFDKIN